MNEKLITYRLSQNEYLKMKNLLQHEPNVIEWTLFSALWSEHCSYKSSKTHLKKFAFRNEMTPEMSGENAGIVDLGFGERIAFKMESHNHPSYIEPKQGAATGVGGILRDIFTMGARPIMLADYLCFGEPHAPRMKSLVHGAVAGISSYGNCVGVPTVTGQTEFHKKYNKNILVNALAVGYFAPDQNMALSAAKGAGNWVVYVGAKTGRDGIHGAAMASASFSDNSEDKKPNVQIGDPFYEKLLIEACLEVLEKNLVLAMQDMGAAGLTSSSFEMAVKGQSGLEIDLKKVPLRDSSMLADEILLSESQERMLLICEPHQFDELYKTFKKWNLEAVILGQVRSEPEIILKWGNETLVKIDPQLIIEQAPQYDQQDRPSWKPKNKVKHLTDIKHSYSHQDWINLSIEQFKLNRFLWISSQYDQRVGAKTASACENSVAFVQLPHSNRGLGLVLGCRPEVIELDAQLGAYDAVFYPALQLAIKGAKAIAITDCLNFGNPQKENIMTEFVTCVEAIADAAKKINAPVISGNVSFYNETLEDNIISTPAIGVVGLRDHVHDIIPDQFQVAYEHLICVRLKWSESWLYLQNLLSPLDSLESAKIPFEFVQNSELSVPDFIQKTSQLDSLWNKNLIRVSSIKVIGLGGIANTCLKMSTEDIGFDLSFDQNPSIWKDLFYGFILTTSEYEKTLSFLKSHYEYSPVEIFKIGETTTSDIVFSSEEKISSQLLNQKMQRRI